MDKTLLTVRALLTIFMMYVEYFVISRIIWYIFISHYIANKEMLKLANPVSTALAIVIVVLFNFLNFYFKSKEKQANNTTQSNEDK